MTIHEFGPFTLDVDRKVLLCEGKVVSLGGRAVATLAVLIAAGGRVVGKDELLEAVWGVDVAVEESNIAQHVYVLRRALRSHGIEGAIETIPRRGYRFVPPRRAHPALDTSTTGIASIAASEAVASAAVASKTATIGFPGEGSVMKPMRACARAIVALCCACAIVSSTSRAPAPLRPQSVRILRLANYFFGVRTPDALLRSEMLFDSLVRTDPHSAAAYAGVAKVELMLADYHVGRVLDRVRYRKANDAIAHALALDIDSHDAHAARAMLLHIRDHDPIRAQREIERAVALDPSEPNAHLWRGVILADDGHPRQAEDELRRAIAADPTSAPANVWLAGVLYQEGRYDDSIAYARTAVDIDPQRIDGFRDLGLSYELRGDLSRATATFRRMQALRTDVGANALLAEAEALDHRRAAARSDLRPLLRSVSPEATADVVFALFALGEDAQARSLWRIQKRRILADEPHVFSDPRFVRVRDRLRDV